MTDPALHGWSHLPGGGFPAHAGPLWYKPGQDGVPPLFAMLADTRHINVHGIVHGGMLMTFADTGMGITIWEALERTPCVTIQFSIQFLDAAMPGDFLELDVEVLRQSSTVVFVRGLLRAGQRRIAAADGVWKTIRPR